MGQLILPIKTTTHCACQFEAGFRVAFPSETATGSETRHPGITSGCDLLFFEFMRPSRKLTYPYPPN